MTPGVPIALLTLDEPRSVHLWKAVAPFVSLEEQLFAHDPRASQWDAERFVVAALPEASPFGRVA